MFIDHPVFTCPDDNAVIWRYMKLSKFFNMLTSGELYFSKVDLLGDPYECAMPWENVKRWKQNRFDEIEEQIKQLPPNLSQKDREERIANIRAYLEPTEARRLDNWSALMQYTYVNCWHINECESAAMWSLYLRGAEGVAIRSSIGKLKQAVANDQRETCIGKVSYIDYQKDFIPVTNGFYPAVHKRNSFAHENEVRAVFLDPMQIRGKHEPTKPGVRIASDMDALIDCVLLAPTSKPFVTETVSSIVGKYAFDSSKVVRSELFDPPTYNL